MTARVRRNRPARRPRISRGAMTVWGLMMAVFFAEMFGYAWCRVQCVQIGYRISTEREKKTRLTEVQHNLKTELARLKSPDRIARIAGERLGLTMPKTDQTIVLR